MALLEDLQKQVGATFKSAWTQRDGSAVPGDTSVTLKNDAMNLDAVVLYADLDQSTALVDQHSQTFAAEVYKSFLHCAAKIINAQGGEITAYDGDRIMAIFLHGNKNTDAAKTALKINYAVKRIINPAIAQVYGEDAYKVGHVVGVDRSALLVAKTGVRGANDLVWVGRAANHAAKLSALSEPGFSSYITEEVYDAMLDEAKFREKDGAAMWEVRTWTKMKRTVYRSHWTWRV